ncbi:MAG: hypothetical protein MUO76_12595 [Anaerolineaceae bacterium]|nr:hypothetical protein [Anaerolineaceae bacterium]
MKINLYIRAQIITVLLVITFSSLACQIQVGGPEPPDRKIPVSQEAAINAEKIWNSSIENNNSNKVAFTLTEEQITSYVALQLQSNINSTFTEPQIFLDNGVISIYGKAEQSLFNANFYIALQPTIDDTGMLSFEITTADFGPLPVPSDFLENFSSIVNNVLNASIFPGGSNFHISNVFISNGMITIEGILQ